MKVTKEVLIEALQRGAGVIHRHARKNEGQVSCPICPANFICNTEEGTGNCINDIVSVLIDQAKTLNGAKKQILG